jgi:3-hydroxyisobutyrate dehydrogenase
MSEPAATEILWIGLGQMGTVLSSRLSGRFRVVGVDPRREARELSHLWKGADGLASAFAQGTTAPVVIICLPHPYAFVSTIEELLESEAVEQVSVVINLSTVGPRVAEEGAMTIESAAPNVTYVESLITGGVQRAARGDITLLVSCRGKLPRKVRAILRVLAKRLEFFDTIHDAAVAKLANNVAMLGAASAAIEALDLGVRSGLPLDVVFRVLQNGTGDSYILKNSLRRALLDGDKTTGFAARLAIKDVDLALDLSAAVSCPLPHLEIVRKELREVVKDGGADETFARIGSLRGLDQPAYMDASTKRGAASSL